MARILMPYDGSQSSKRALDHVIRSHADAAAVELVLINVQEPPVMFGDYLTASMVEQIDSGQRSYGDSLLQEATARLKEAGIQVRAEVIVGNIADSIVAQAVEKHCDSIVMGTRGMGSFGNLLLGSVASKVVHQADMPVTLVK
ncbi:universal stress protein [Algiphilus sp. W345]|uniref:Universal stress protein n=1 Tax=Banduia mediterranea TaxID=3075609 RepID=A0ABU2WJB4_9GAMM|nr:universal stress protein [Algiphilus sp. W345]MDT0497932.1 universal stress protein [Algiphilus sp. W345]